jgi:hypothetical protein
LKRREEDKVREIETKTGQEGADVKKKKIGEKRIYYFSSF